MRIDDAFRRKARRGLAPLELTMTLPIFAAILALILYIGKVSLAQIYFANNLRLDVWALRDEKPPTPKNLEPFNFVQYESGLNAPISSSYAGEVPGEISDEKEETIRAKPTLFFDKWEHKEISSCYLYVDPWDAKSIQYIPGYSPTYSQNDGTAQERGDNRKVYYHQTKNYIYLNNLPFYYYPFSGYQSGGSPPELELPTPIRNAPYRAGI